MRSDAVPYESTILSEVLAAIGALPGFRFWRQTSGVLYGPRGQRIRTAVKGAADITGIGPGGIRIEIEVKRPGRKPEAHQLAFAAMIRSHGGVYLVVHSAAEALDGVTPILSR